MVLRRFWQHSRRMIAAILLACLVGAAEFGLPAGTAVASGTPIAQLSISLGNYVSATQNTQWTFQFTTPTGLASGTLLFDDSAPGVTFSANSQDYSLYYSLSSNSNNTQIPITVRPASPGFDLVLDASVPAGAQLTLYALNTTNPTVTFGQASLSVPVVLGAYPPNAFSYSTASTTLTFNAPYLPLSVQTSSSLSGASGVTWTFSVQTTAAFSSGLVVNNSGGVQGARFSSNPADYVLRINHTPVPATVSLGSGGAFALTTSALVPAGATLTVEAYNTTNPTVPTGQTELEVPVALTLTPTANNFMDVARTTVTFQSPASSSTGSGPATVQSPSLVIGQQMAPLPPASLPGSDSTSSNFSPYTLGFDNQGDTLNRGTPSNSQTLDTQTTTINGTEVIGTVGSTSYYLTNAAAVEIPVQCTSNPNWVTACNVKVEDANNNPWPNLQVINPQGGTVSLVLGNGTTFTMPQVAVNTIAQPATVPVVSPQSQVPTSANNSLNSPDYVSSGWGPINAPGGLTLVPMPDCSGGVGTASATLLIPLNGISAQIKLVTTEVSAMLSSLAGDLGAEEENQGGASAYAAFGNIWGSSSCAFEGFVGMFALSTHSANWAEVLNTGLEGTYSQVNSTTASSLGQGQVLAFSAYNDSRTLNLAQLPLSEFQVAVMPYKILYQPPGDNSHSEFTLSQGASSQTDFTIAQETTNTVSTSNTLSWNLGLSAENVGSVNTSGTWDQTVTQANTSAISKGQSVAWTSAEDQQWQSYTSANNNGLPQLDTPGTQPWMYDEFVLEVHPQFALYDGYWCTDGTSDCGVNSSGQAQPLPAQGSTVWTLLGAQPTQFDIRAGDLLACAQGTAMPIPGTNPSEELTPSQCQSLLQLDPFAAAGTQSLDPSSTSAAGAIGNLAIPVEHYSAGMPGEGTNGSYMVQLSQSQETTNSAQQTSAFTASIDASITNGTDISAGVGPPVLQPTGGVSFENTIRSGQSVTITYSQSQTASQVVQEAASATLSDLLNPIETSIFLDTRWDTLMFQVPQPQVTSVTPSSGLGTGGLTVQVSGQDFYGGPVAVQFCPIGSSTGCTSATSSQVSSDTTLSATVPAVPPGTYCIEVVDAGGPSTCSAASQFTVETPQQQAESSGLTFPIVSSVSPSSGPDGGGTAVVLTGANLEGVQQVWFGTATPQDNPGLYNQYLESGSPNGLPTLSPAPFTVVNDGEIVACAPPVAAAETVWVAVYGTDGWSTVTPADQFTYTSGAGTTCTPSASSGTTASPPTVTAVSPSSGPITGGMMVTVNGSGFQDLQQSVACTVYGCPGGETATLLIPPKVQFCGSGAVICSPASNVQVIDSNTLLVQAPPSELGTGTVDIEVMGPGGWSTPNAGDQFTYTPSSACTTSNGACAGPGSLSLGVNPPVSVAGLGSAQVLATLLNGLGSPLSNVPVLISNSGSQSSTTEVVYTDSNGLASVNLTSAGPGTLSVEAEVYGQPNLVDRASVTFEPLPIVTGLSVHSGPTTGGTSVTISGLGFTGATTVYVGSSLITTFTVAPDGTAITFTTPPGLGTVDVRVGNDAAISGTGVADQFTYNGTSVLAPQVTSVTPSGGPAAGGTSVVIGGSGFTGATAVLFGSTPAAHFTVVSDSKITATAPPGSGTVSVTVVTANGVSSAGPNSTFTYITPLSTLTRTLSAGWNTLSVPFPLASNSNSLAAVLSDQASSLMLALTYDCATSQEAATGDCWQQVTGPLPAPMQGVFLELRSGSGPVTATLVPASSLNAPPQYGLQPGWNLVGPSSLTDTESDQTFLNGMPSSSVPLLVDPNGSLQAVSNPGQDTTHFVQNGYAYWVFSESEATLAGQIPTGGANP
ncbi:MAG: IPT/TIG domain-containing protein [Firmicutes bacterium]|nr:IPT/TIG domain-containing protein [Alicyclobacillaceae bacterium]MCL6496110.1 IPT/TIG domain-containing protein [Bacillota bacterium]